MIVARVTEAPAGPQRGAHTALEVLQRSLALGTARPLGAIRHEEVVIIAPGSPPISRLHSAARAARGTRASRSASAPATRRGLRRHPDAYITAALTLSYAGGTVRSSRSPTGAACNCCCSAPAAWPGN